MEHSDQEQLSSILRVRHRLGSTPDRRLPTILEKLIPRLFRKLEPLLKQLSETKNDAASTRGGEDEMDPNSRLEHRHPIANHQGTPTSPTSIQVDRRILGPMIQHLMGTISHAMDRIETNVNLEVDSWLPVMLPLLYEVESKFSFNSLSKFLEIGIGRVGKEHMDQHIIPSLLEILDTFFNQVRNAETFKRSETVKQRSWACAWLLMEAIAISAGFVIVEDVQGRKVHFPKEWKPIDIHVGSQESIKSVMQKDGCGFLDLLLDMTLICSNSEISENGWRRIHQTRRFDCEYLKQLQQLLMHFAHGSLSEERDGDRFCLVNTLSSYRFARKAPKKRSVQEIIKGNKSEIEDENCSIRVACCLLILIVGDEVAIPILREYDSFQDLWKCVLGSQPLDKDLFRPPLPYEEAGKAIKFIVQKFRPRKEEPRIEVIIDLIILIQENKLVPDESSIPLLNFGYQLFRSVENMCDGSLKLELLNSCIASARDNISIILANDVTNTRSRRGLLVHVDNFGDNLGQQRYHTKSYHSDAFRAVSTRSISYKIIANVVSENWKELGMTRENFDMLNLLFRCAALEDSKAQESLSLAIRAILKFHKNIVGPSGSNSLESQCIVAPVLPSLLFAASSGPYYSRIASLECCNELMAKMDPDAARFICWYLQDDPDSRVSKRATDVLTILQKNFSSSIQKDDEANTIIFLDMSNDINKDLVFYHFNAKVDTLSKEFFISSSTVESFLKESNFDMDATRAKILSNSKSIINPLDTDSKMTEYSFLCDICYDDFSSEEGFALGCQHMYCRPCWKNHLISKAEIPRTFYNVSCPHHGCEEGLSAENIIVLEQSLLPKWKSSIGEKIIASDKSYSSCPGTDCMNVAHSMNSCPKYPTEVSCSLCNKSYCFQCKKIPHQLVSCFDFDKWNREIVGTAELWISKNAKPCPSCNAPIEKNQGCNHMLCTNCNKDFCWICLSIMDMNTPHVCNEFVQSNPRDTNEVNRFFAERYTIHEDEEFFCRDEVKRMESDDRDDLLIWNHSFIKQENFDLLHETLQILVEARSYLKHSYISAWAYKQQHQNNHKAFECHQATLELFTERLGRMAYHTNFKDIYDYGGLHDIESFFRGMNFHFLAVKMYVKRIQTVQKSLEQDL